MYISLVSDVDTSNKALPIVCTKKYLIAASVSWKKDCDAKIGTIDKRLSSSPAHVYTHVVLDRAIIVPKIRVEANNVNAGNMIRLWGELSPSGKKLEAFS